MDEYRSLFKKRTELDDAELEQAEQQLKEEKIALKVACEQMQRLVKEVIFPELEKVVAAAKAEDYDDWFATITQRKFFSDEPIEFATEAKLKGRGTLRYEGDPDSKLFTCHSEVPFSAKDSTVTITFDKLTEESVRHAAQTFVRKALRLTD